MVYTRSATPCRFCDTANSWSVKRADTSDISCARRIGDPRVFRIADDTADRQRAEGDC